MRTLIFTIPPTASPLAKVDVSLARPKGIAATTAYRSESPEVRTFAYVYLKYSPNPSTQSSWAPPFEYWTPARTLPHSCRDFIVFLLGGVEMVAGCHCFHNLPILIAFAKHLYAPIQLREASCVRSDVRMHETAAAMAVRFPQTINATSSGCVANHVDGACQPGGTCTRKTAAILATIQNTTTYVSSIRD